MITFQSCFFIADDSVDRDGHKFDNTGVECPDILPVTYEFNDKKIIGMVEVKRNDNSYIGDFSIIESFVPENLSDKFLNLLRPAISGFIEQSREENGIRTIEKCSIRSVTLTRGINSDSRIKQIGAVHELDVKGN